MDRNYVNIIIFVTELILTIVCTSTSCGILTALLFFEISPFSKDLICRLLEESGWGPYFFSRFISTFKI